MLLTSVSYREGPYNLHTRLHWLPYYKTGFQPSSVPYTHYAVKKHSEQHLRFPFEKFDNYFSFIDQKFGPVEKEKAIVGFNVEINDDWSVYGLNTSLTSFAGLDDGDNSLLTSDTKRLNVYTRDLCSWLEKNSKKKILLMHHPFEEHDTLDTLLTPQSQ